MARLTVLSGLPGAGKSTIARRIVARTGASLVGRDELRAALVNCSDEALLTFMLVDLARALLACGCDVVVDAWNLHPDDWARWEDLAWLQGAELRWRHVATPVEECVIRDARRPNPNGADRVRGAAKEYAGQLAALAA